MMFVWKTTAHCVTCVKEVTYYTKALGMEGFCPFCGGSMGETMNDPGTYLIEVEDDEVPWWKFWAKHNRYTE